MFSQDVQLQWRFARKALGSAELGVSRFTYEPGARMPWGHRHREQEEAYVVVGGSGSASSTTRSSSLSKSDALLGPTLSRWPARPRPARAAST